jgi:hypothetical protein
MNLKMLNVIELLIYIEVNTLLVIIKLFILLTELLLLCLIGIISLYILSILIRINIIYYTDKYIYMYTLRYVCIFLDNLDVTRNIRTLILFL